MSTSSVSRRRIPRRSDAGILGRYHHPLAPVLQQDDGEKILARASCIWRLIDPGVTRAPFWRWETSSDSSRSPFRPRVAAATPRLWQRMGCHRRTQSANEGTISIPSQLVVDVMCYLLLIFRFREPEASYLRALAAQ